MPGYFISLEGIDGSGKTTQAKLLKNRIEMFDFEVLLTREPGGVKGAEDIRSLLVRGSKDRWSVFTEILLFFAARRHHLERCILPALEKDKIVLCDRFTDSTRVYQGFRDENIGSLIDKIHKLVIGLEPNLTIIIDTNPKKSLARGLERNTNEDRFEMRGLKFQQNVQEKYLSLAKLASRYRIVNGNQGKNAVHEEIWKIVSSELQL